jgi:sterol desaturase/sphingolipid hydroxylase (fatty acid hydroxylase superfamily)
MLERLQRLLQSDSVASLAQQSLRAALLLLVFGLVIAWLERRSGAPTRQYRSPGFWFDAGLWIVNGSGIFFLLGGTLLLLALQRAWPDARLALLEPVPVALRYVIYLLALDFGMYWLHRLQHASRWLWAFHATHHSQTELSFATTARSHPVEQWLTGLLLSVPLVLLLGTSPAAWLPVALAQQFLFTLTHSRLDWGYGPAYRLLVSPVFHSVHHSLDPRHHDRNFAAIFSFWDYLFGTAAPRPAARIEACGLQDAPAARRWLDPLVDPLRRLRAGARVVPADGAGATRAP